MQLSCENWHSVCISSREGNILDVKDVFPSLKPDWREDTGAHGGLSTSRHTLSLRRTLP